MNRLAMSPNGHMCFPNFTTQSPQKENAIMSTKSLIVMIVAGLLAVGFNSIASAAITSSVTTYGTSNANFVTMNALVSGSDLLETALGSGSTSGDFVGTNDSTPPHVKLTDGTSGITAFSYSQAAIDTNSSGYTVEFVLDTSVNTLGYDITSIASYAGLSSTAADFRQDFSIEISTVGSAGFTSLGTFSSGDGQASRVLITDDALAPLATGVDVIRFVSSSGIRGTYRELDVFGTATVPEPASLALLGIGALTIAGRRSRV